MTSTPCAFDGQRLVTIFPFFLAARGEGGKSYRTSIKGALVMAAMLLCCAAPMRAIGANKTKTATADEKPPIQVQLAQFWEEREEDFKSLRSYFYQYWVRIVAYYNPELILATIVDDTLYTRFINSHDFVQIEYEKLDASSRNESKLPQYTFIQGTYNPGVQSRHSPRNIEDFEFPLHQALITPFLSYTK